jgi:hypothetical protein
MQQDGNVYYRGASICYVIVLAVATMVQSGCASSAEINAPVSRVWEELPTVAEDLHLDFTELTPANGRFELTKVSDTDNQLRGTMVSHGVDRAKVTARAEFWSGSSLWTLLVHARDEDAEREFLQKLKLASEQSR